MRQILAMLVLGMAAFPAYGAECRDWEKSLSLLRREANDPDFRSAKGQCLVRHHLDKEPVAREVLSIIKDPEEDLLLREDLVAALGEAPLRKRLKVEESPAPELDKQDLQAVGRTVASAQSILAVAQAIESMDEIVPVTKLEQDFFRALSTLAEDSRSPVLLREAAVSALEGAARRVSQSGVYDPKNLRMAEDTLKRLADADDNGAYYSGANRAYGRLASSGVPFFVLPKDGRMIASEKNR